MAAAIGEALSGLEEAIRLGGNEENIRRLLSQLESFEVDSNAHASASYALRAWLTGDAQEAAWAARRAYESREQIASDEFDFSVFTAVAEESILRHSAVQAELEAQAKDLAAIESGNAFSVIDGD